MSDVIVVNRDFPLFIARLNLSDGPQQSDSRMAAVDAQRRASTDGNSNYPGQSRSFRILQMMTGGDDETGTIKLYSDLIIYCFPQLPAQ